MKKFLFVFALIMALCVPWAQALPPVPVDYLCFTANTAGATIKLTKTGTPTAVTLETSTDGSLWSTYTFETEITLTNVGDKVYFRNASSEVTGFSIAADNYYRFLMSGSIAASGNVMSLVDKSCQTTTIPCNSCFENLFQNCSTLTVAPALPATTLANTCYSNMFQGCSSLTTAPELPATTLADSCYRYMFRNCSALTTAPALPATNLATACYNYMFESCSTLTVAPALPATNLATNCYGNMFRYCTSLTAAPALPAETLAAQCYSAMFLNCTSLTTAPALPAETLANDCYRQMFVKCSSLTTAPELPATTLANSCYASMFQMCTSLTTAPELPAETLADQCYAGMFQACTTLTTSPALPADSLAYQCYMGMFQACSTLTTLPTLPATTLADQCYAGMFKACTSLEVNTAAPGVAWSLPAGATVGNSSLTNMFQSTGGNFTGTPVLGTTYYIASAPAPAERFVEVDLSTLSQVTKENNDTVIWFADPFTVMNEKASSLSGANAWIGGKSSRTYSTIYANQKLTLSAPANLQIDSLEIIYPNTYSYGAWESTANWTNVDTRSISTDKTVATIRTKIPDLPLVAIPTTNAKATQIKIFYSDFNGVHTPTFTPNSGSFYNAQYVAINAEAGATIKYSVNGGDFVEYTNPIWVSETSTIAAYAEISNVQSDTNTTTFTVHPHYTSLAGLIALGNPTSMGTPLSVDIVDAEITKIDDFSGWSDYYVQIKCDDNNVVLYKNGTEPADWEVGGKVSGNVKGIWEYSQYGAYTLSLAATEWSELTYTAAPKGLSKQILDSVAGKTAGETVTINLNAGEEYPLNCLADAGLVNLVINGNGAIVNVDSLGQITGMQGIEINNVNFNCVDATLAPVALSATPDSAVHASKGNFYGNMQNVYVDTCAIVLNGCNFAQLPTSLVSNNGAAWVLGGLTINNCVVQFCKSNTKPYINFETAPGNVGAIKNFTINASTLFNDSIDDAHFIRFANASNGQATKAFPADPHEYITFTNNTFVNICTKKNFGNNLQNNNGFVDEVKGNVFFNTYRLNKYFQSNHTFNFTVADNAIDGDIITIDGTDKLKIATEDTALVLTLPEGALDFTKIDSLVNNFAPSATSYAGSHGFGDPRWASATTPVSYLAPVYNTTGDPTSGILRWDTLQCTNYTLVENTTTTLNAGWYVVNDTVRTGTLTCNGAVNLILADSAKLTVAGTSNNAGIQVSGTGDSLTIYAQSTEPAQMGTLIATGGTNSAGIGGGDDSDGSNITINGGKVTANGGNGAAGIGGGKNASSSNIIISTNLVVKADGNNPPTTVITNDGSDLASSLAGKRYATVEPAPATATITANVNNTDFGSVTGAGSYDIGSQATLTATANEGYRFSNWTNANGLTVSSANPWTLTVASDTTVTANFAALNVEVQEEVDVPAITFDYELGYTGVSSTFDMSMVYDAIGCNATNAIVYGYNPTTEAYVLGAMSTCDGWFSAAGVPTAWNETTTPFCIKFYNDGTFWYCTQPNVVEYGANYTCSWLLVNPTTGDAVQYNFSMNDIVRTATITANVNDESMGSVTGAGTYDIGSQITLTATPSAHYHFVNWSNGSTVNPLTITVEKDSSLTANFAIDQHTVATAVNDETMGSVTEGGTYNYGAQITLTATPNEHFHFVNWSNGSTANPLTITVEKDSSLTANFAIDTHIVALATNDDNFGAVEGAGTYDYGTQVTAIAVPAAHYHFVNWSNGETNDTIVIDLAGDTSIVANFAIDTHTVTLNANDATFGAVEGAGTYNYGTQVTAIAVPAAHYHFVNWSNGETNDTIVIDLVGDTTLIANFAIDQHTIAGVANDGTLGTVTGSATVNHGTAVTLTAIPTNGNQFVVWSNGATTPSITIVADQDSSVTAYFVTTFVLDPTVVDPVSGDATSYFQVSSDGYCQDEYGNIDFTVVAGNAEQYMIEFVDPAFADVAWTNLDGNSLSIYVPAGATAGVKGAKVKFRSAVAVINSETVYVESDYLPVTFVVNLPKEVIRVAFDDVLVVDNSDNNFTTYQWYRNGEPIEGATKGYYQEVGGLNGDSYYVCVNPGADDMARTCLFTAPISPVTAKSITVYPSPVNSNTTIELRGFESGNHMLRVYNNNGVEVMSQEFTGFELRVDFGNLSRGNYLVTVDGVVEKVVKY